MTADALRTPRRGTPSAHALQAWAPGARHERSSASVTGRVLHSVRRPVHVSSLRAPRFVGSRWDRSRRHRGWANLRKREEPAPGSSKADVARLAARHRSARRGVVRQKRKVVEATVPARNEGPGLVARTSMKRKLQKSSGGVWPRISSANALQKERQGRVNAGLVFGEGRRVKPSFGTGGEGYVGVPVSPE